MNVLLKCKYNGTVIFHGDLLQFEDDSKAAQRLISTAVCGICLWLVQSCSGTTERARDRVYASMIVCVCECGCVCVGGCDVWVGGTMCCVGFWVWVFFDYRFNECQRLS